MLLCDGTAGGRRALDDGLILPAPAAGYDGRVTQAPRPAPPTGADPPLVLPPRERANQVARLSAGVVVGSACYGMACGTSKGAAGWIAVVPVFVGGAVYVRARIAAQIGLPPASRATLTRWAAVAYVPAVLLLSGLVSSLVRDGPSAMKHDVGLYGPVEWAAAGLAVVGLVGYVAAELIGLRSAARGRRQRGPAAAADGPFPAGR